MGRFKTILAIFIVATFFWLLKNNECLAIEIENFDSYTASSSVSAISVSWASTTASYAYVSANTYGSSSPNSAQLLADTHFIIPDGNIGNYFSDISFQFRFQNANFALIDKLGRYIGRIIFDKDASDGYGDIYLTNYNGISTTNRITIANAGTIADDEWRTLIVNWDETNSQYRAKLDTTTYTAYATTTYSTPARLLWSSITGGSPFYIDNFIYNDEFGTVTVIDVPNWQGTVEVGSYESLDFVSPLYCTVNQTCRVWFGYSYDSIGARVYLVNFYEDILPITYRDLADREIRKDYINIPEQSTPQTINYYLYYYISDVNASGTDAYYPLKVIWQDESVWLEELLSQYNCATICDNVATTSEGSWWDTSTYWDEIRYGFECAGRKLGCYLLVPDENTMINFKASINTLNEQFPFSIYKQLENELQGLIYTATSSAITLEPLLPGCTNCVIASSTYMTNTFPDLWPKIYLIFKIIIFLAAVYYLIERVISLTKKPDTQP